jgi:hypothetical protein
MDNENIPGQILSTANQALDFFDKIYAKVVSIKMKKLSIKNYLRAYYLEVINRKVTESEERNAAHIQCNINSIQNKEISCTGVFLAYK